jgi:Zn-dependent peptidase ImmA (M78 family)
MRKVLGFGLEARAASRTWEEALRAFIEQADEVGILVMVSGVVGNNNSRKLDVEEFRGFALADHYAPLVFINGADSKAGQMFTLAHELAHIWLGQSAVSDVDAALRPGKRAEKWCNRVAAEFLVPLAAIREQTAGENAVLDRLNDLTRYFKVSSLVMLRRLLDAGRIDRNEFGRAYAAEQRRFSQSKGGGGGNFYYTQAARVSKRFGRALVTSVLEGQTLYRDAFQMLGIKKEQTFREFGRSLGHVI